MNSNYALLTRKPVSECIGSKILRKKLAVAFVLILLSLTASSAVSVFPAKAHSTQSITILPNGDITPLTAPIQRNGYTYTIFANLTDPIVIQIGNIVLDGAGYTLAGSGEGAAVNIVATNVIVENLQATGWKTGILGTYNNDTIAYCEFTNNEIGIAIYANDYVVIGNNVSGNRYGLYIKGGAVRPQGDNNLIIQNQIFANNEAFDINESNGTIITQNNVFNNSVILEWATTSNYSANNIFYANNFTNNNQVLETASPVDTSVSERMAATWDNGTIGNYWSDYQSKYPNATEVDHTGIGDTPYKTTLDTSYYAFNRWYGGLRTVIDHCPLLTPVLVSTNKISLQPFTPPPTTQSPATSLYPSTSPTPSPTPSSTPTPSMSPTSSPPPSPTQTPTPTQSAPTAKPTTTPSPTHNNPSLQVDAVLIGVVAAVVAVALISVAFVLRKRKQASITAKE
jgi:nitrous oxidase accessory protein NosD